MIKLFFEYKENINGYWGLLPTLSGNEESLLYLLFLSFNPGRGDIVVENDNEKAYIQNILFLDDFGECPTLELSKENYNNVIEVWNQNINSPMQYLVLFQDNEGWVTLERKNQLSTEDLDWIEREKQEQLKHEQRK